MYVFILNISEHLKVMKQSKLNDSWLKKCKDLMSRYPEVASTIECSAKQSKGVLDVFVSAQKEILQVHMTHII